MAPVAAKTRVAVIGAGMVGVTTASFLLRKGHDVVLLDPASPAAAHRSATPAVLTAHRWCRWRCQVPSAMSASGSPTRLRPLSLPLFYLPRVAPWLIRFIRAGRPSKVAAQAQALRSLLQDGIETLAPLLHQAGASDLILRAGHLFVYRTLAGWQSDQAAWRLRADNGIRWDEFDVGELRQLDANLSGEYRKGVLVRENGHTVNPHRLVISLASALQRDGGRKWRVASLASTWSTAGCRRFVAKMHPLPPTPRSWPPASGQNRWPRSLAIGCRSRPNAATIS